MRIGLLIVDMQNQFLCDGQFSQAEVCRTAEYINHIAESMRESAHAVIHIRDIEGWTEETSSKFDIIPQIIVKESDLQVNKLYSNAFWFSDLEEQLRANGVEFVIVSGFAAEYSVRFTYNGARERGFKAVILQDGIISSKEDALQAGYRNRRFTAGYTPV